MQLVEEIQALTGPHVPPIIVLSTRAMTSEEELDFARLTRISIVKISTLPGASAR